MMQGYFHSLFNNLIYYIIIIYYMINTYYIIIIYYLFVV